MTTSTVEGSKGAKYKSAEYVPAGFFVLRTPLLPFEEILSWNEGLGGGEDSEDFEEILDERCRELRGRLRDLIDRREISEALYLASPSFYDSLAHWKETPENRRGQRTEESLVRYFMRMAGRCTPFGLFAGCSVGEVGEETRIRLRERGASRRFSRLDMDYVCALSDALSVNSEISSSLVYRTNSSLYHAAGRTRYIEAQQAKLGRFYKLVAVESSELLSAVLDEARTGATVEQLVEVLVGLDPEIEREDCRDFVLELVESQLLISELSPVVTGADPVETLVGNLEKGSGSKKVVETLEFATKGLRSIDCCAFGEQIEAYPKIIEALEELPAPVDPARLFQVDLFKSVESATLGAKPIGEIVRGVEILRQMNSYSPDRDPCVKFRDAFLNRYGDREVRLVEALDEESGIGFQKSDVPSAEGSPLLRGVGFPPVYGEARVSWSASQEIQLRKFIDACANGRDELVLEDPDLEKLKSGSSLPLPKAFVAMATLSAASEAAMRDGEFRVLLNFVSGPSGANLLGRFCHLDPSLEEGVREHLRAEEALDPDALFVEIVHLPEGRHGNIIYRPVLRSHEIVYMAKSGAALDRQIPITDLFVSVTNGRIMLRSARLGREILPRLTCAHNSHHQRNLGAYRFLNALQRQLVLGGASWDWGVIGSEPFLPRVVTGRLVLARAQWNLNQEEIAELCEHRGPRQVRDLQSWRHRRAVPRFVTMREGESGLPVDFDNLLSVRAFGNLLRKRPAVSLVEMFPGPEDLYVRGPEGRYLHELIVPFTARDRRPEVLRTRALPPEIERSDTVFIPGSRWLYVKLYTGTSTADEILRAVVAPVVRTATDAGILDGWFFVRLNDPNWHIRLRITGQAERLMTEVMPLLQRALQPHLDSGRVWRVQLDTYEREIDRYGPSPGIDLSERIFRADSETAITLLRMIEGDSGAEARWQIVLLSTVCLLDDMEITGDARLEFVRQTHGMFAQEFRGEDAQLRAHLNSKYRSLRRTLDTVMNAERDPTSLVGQAWTALRARSAELVPIISELKEYVRTDRVPIALDDLARSYIHMSANRLLRSQARAQEFVIWDILLRHYKSVAARARRATEVDPAPPETGS